MIKVLGQDVSWPFYVKVVFSMDDATVFMLKKGQTSISNLLLENYTDLGLNDGEFLLLLMLMKFDQQKKTLIWKPCLR